LPRARPRPKSCGSQALRPGARNPSGRKKEDSVDGTVHTRLSYRQAGLRTRGKGVNCRASSLAGVLACR
jgi:hypothetical protein